MVWLYTLWALGFVLLLSKGAGTPLWVEETLVPVFSMWQLYGVDVLLLLSTGVFVLGELLGKTRMTTYILPSRVGRFAGVGVVWVLLLTFFAWYPEYHLLSLGRGVLWVTGLGIPLLYTPLFRLVMARVLLWWLLVQGALAWGQLFLGTSMGLQWWGEPLLHTAMYNVATIHVGMWEFLRGYGFFVHPNILGVWALIVLLLLRYCGYGKTLSTLLGVAVVLAGLASFSKVYMLLVVLLWGLGRIRTTGLWITMVTAGWLVLVTVFAPLVWGGAFLWERITQWMYLWTAYSAAPLGGGAGSAPMLLDYAMPGIAVPWVVHPFHNIFGLLLLEHGPVALLFVLWCLLGVWRHAKELKRVHRLMPLGALCILLFYGIGDHFFLTLPQGQAALIVLVVIMLHEIWGNNTSKKSTS